jgi:hypothetical protein
MYTKDEIISLMKEEGFLRDAKKLYGMNIEPRGKELYFLMKEIPQDTTWKEAYSEYVGKYLRSATWQDDWKNFKLANNLKEMAK